MSTIGNTLFSQIEINGQLVDISTLDANDGLYQLPAGYTSAHVVFTMKDNTSFPRGVFEENTYITGVTLPDAMNNIASYSFHGVTNINTNDRNAILAINPYAFDAAPAPVVKQNLNATAYPVSNQESSFPVTKSGDFLLINDANFTFDSSKWSAICADANVSINSISFDSLTRYLAIYYTASQPTDHTTIVIDFMGDDTYNSGSWVTNLTVTSSGSQSLNATTKSVFQEVNSFPATLEDVFLEINDANFTFDSSKWSATPNSPSVSINSINYYSGATGELKVNYTVSQEVLSSSVTINFSGDASYNSNSWLCSFEIKQASTPTATLSWKQDPITITESTSISGYVDYTGSGTLNYSSSNPNMYVDASGFVYVPAGGVDDTTNITVSDGTLSATVVVNYHYQGKQFVTAGWYENGSQINNLDLVIGSASDHTLTFQATPNDSWSFMDPMFSGISVNTTTGEITITGSNIIMTGNVNISANRMEDATYYSGYSSVNINIYPAGTDLDFHYTDSSVNLDNSAMTTSNPYLYNNTGIDIMMYPVTYSSADTNVATVASDGTISFVGGGTTTVTATISDGTSTHTATITVNCSVQKQYPNANWYENGNPVYNGLNLVQGAIDAHTLTFQATPSDSWTFNETMSLPTGVTFNTTTGEINVTANSSPELGTYYCTATRMEDSSYYASYPSIAIKVYKAGTDLNFYYDMETVSLDNSAMTTSTPMLNNTTGIDTMMYPINYSSADTSVATVDNSGMITYVGPGQTIVTATLSNGNETHTATITVYCTQMSA